MTKGIRFDLLSHLEHPLNKSVFAAKELRMEMELSAQRCNARLASCTTGISVALVPQLAPRSLMRIQVLPTSISLDCRSSMSAPSTKALSASLTSSSAPVSTINYTRSSSATNIFHGLREACALMPAKLLIDIPRVNAEMLEVLPSPQWASSTILINSLKVEMSTDLGGSISTQLHVVEVKAEAHSFTPLLIKDVRLAVEVDCLAEDVKMDAQLPTVHVAVDKFILGLAVSRKSGNSMTQAATSSQPLSLHTASGDEGPSSRTLALSHQLQTWPGKHSFKAKLGRLCVCLVNPCGNDGQELLSSSLTALHLDASAGAGAASFILTTGLMHVSTPLSIHQDMQISSSVRSEVSTATAALQDPAFSSRPSLRLGAIETIDMRAGLVVTDEDVKLDLDFAVDSITGNGSFYK